MSEGPFDGANVIYAYTRKQAIDDGVLVDVTGPARSAGLLYHTVLTSAAYEEAVAWKESDGAHQDVQGRLWDVLMLAIVAIRRTPPGHDRADFKVSVLDRDGSRKVVSMYIHIGPGDDATPVFTVMLVGQD